MGDSPDRLAGHGEYWASLTVALAAGCVALGGLVRQQLGWIAIIPSGLLLFAAIGLLSDAGGGIPSGASAPAILPVFQVALYTGVPQFVGILSPSSA